MLQYLFTAVHNDGTEVQQTQQDKSDSQKEGSAFCDVNPKDIKTFTLKGNDKVYSVDLESGSFTFDGKEVLINPTEDTNKDSRKLIFFRVNQASVIYPARFFGETKSRSDELGRLVITDSKGEDHTFTKDAIVQQVKEITEDNIEQSVLEVFIQAPKDWVWYDFGYEGKTEKGEVVKKVVRVE